WETCASTARLTTTGAFGENCGTADGTSASNTFQSPGWPRPVVALWKLVGACLSANWPKSNLCSAPNAAATNVRHHNKLLNIVRIVANILMWKLIRLQRLSHHPFR